MLLVGFSFHVEECGCYLLYKQFKLRLSDSAGIIHCILTYAPDEVMFCVEGRACLLHFVWGVKVTVWCLLMNNS